MGPKNPGERDQALGKDRGSPAAPSVGLTYAKPEDNCYVAIAGTAQIVVDAKKVQDLWIPSYQAWFPGGPNDPDLALIKVSVETAEYWSAPALTWPLSAGFVVMAPAQRDDPQFHARIVLGPPT